MVSKVSKHPLKLYLRSSTLHLKHRKKSTRLLITTELSFEFPDCFLHLFRGCSSHCFAGNNNDHQTRLFFQLEDCSHWGVQQVAVHFILLLLCQLPLLLLYQHPLLIPLVLCELRYQIIISLCQLLRYPFIHTSTAYFHVWTFFQEWFIFCIYVVKFIYPRLLCGLLKPSLFSLSFYVVLLC